ncbi:hypothetical protein [Butyrivibrio sp. MB2005]|nr:hypothetical protein [Butyrivibrio sp. MB2005]
MRSAKDREINRRCKLACDRMFIELDADAANAVSSSELAHEMGASGSE